MKKGIIEKAEVADHEKLTKLVKKSKAYLDYSNSQIKKWGNELTITQNYIDSNKVFKLSLGNQIIGCYSYLK